MSAENVELVREGYAAFNRGDIDALADASHPDLVIVQPREVPDSKTYRGKEGLREAFADWPEQWDEFSADLIEVIDVSDTKAVSVSIHHLKARDMEIEQEVAYVHTFRDGLLIRWEHFFSRDEALEAAAASE